MLKSHRVTKIVKKIRFDGAWGELKANYFFQRQSFTKYLRQTSFSCEIVHYGKIPISVSQDFFGSIDKFFILGRILGTRL